MKTFFEILRYGSPGFVYISTLFILINIFGVLCNSLISTISFIIFSFLLIYYLKYKYSIYQNNNSQTNIYISLLQIVAILYSIFFESAYVTNVFNYISDENSGKSDKIFFSIIIILISFAVSMYGKDTLFKLSNLFIIFPVIAIIPCILSLLNNGVSLKPFITTDTNVGFEILNGFIASMIFTADFSFVTNFTKKKKIYKTHFYSGAFAAVIFTTFFGILSALLFGKELFKSIKAPLFSASATVGIFKFEEIILTIFSICLLYRFGCKILFIQSVMKKILNTKKLHYFITTSIACASGILGVCFLNSKNILSFSYAYGIINIICFFIIPGLTQLFKKKNINMPLT